MNINSIYKRLKLSVVCIILVCISIDAFSQRTIALKTRYAAGEVHFNSGKILACEIGFPINNRDQSLIIKDPKKLSIRTLSGEEESLDADLIDFILILTADEIHKLKWTKFYQYKIGYTQKLSTIEWWYLERYGCEKLRGYLGASRFDLDLDGNLWLNNFDSYGKFCLQLKNEDYPTHIMYKGEPMGTLGVPRARKKYLENYFSEDENGLEFLRGRKKVEFELLTNYIEDRCNQ